MGVIFTVGDDTNELLVPYVQQIDSRISREKINNVYLEASLGAFTSLDFWNKVGIPANLDYRDVERKYLDTCLSLDEQFLEVVTRLKQDYNLAILSNDVSEWASYLREKYGLDDIVKFSIISGDVGYRKPSEEIYRLALEKTGANANDCLFIDDRDKNLLPADKIGMKIMKFTRDESDCNQVNIETVSSFQELEQKIRHIHNRSRSGGTT